MTETTIGCGSAFADDDLVPGQLLADSGVVDSMGFDRLAERTMALAQLRRLENPNAGYDLHLADFASRFSKFLSGDGLCVGNFGAANPQGAGAELRSLLAANGAADVGLAVVHGDDVLDLVHSLDVELPERGHTISAESKPIISAHAYIGAQPVLDALRAGAKLVIGGRLADPSIFVALICHRMGWGLDEMDRVAQATLAGHLLECGVHVTGGHFADPPRNEIPFDRPLGAPYATVTNDAIRIGKLSSSGGAVNERTVKAQLVYETHDPEAYLTPDVTANFAGVEVDAAGDDWVQLSGATGREAPSDLKVLVGLDLGFKVVCEMTFGGIGCVGRAELTQEAVQSRLDDLMGSEIDRLRFDIIGFDSLFGRSLAVSEAVEPVEVRLRMAAGVRDRARADALVEHFWRSAAWRAAGGGGQQTSVARWIGVTPCFVPRHNVNLEWAML